MQYTNAKVLLVGESGVGKTGLSNGLAHQKFEETVSTDGAWATHFQISDTARTDGVDREIWLWDFAGQVDYRLVHQLFMDDTAAAVLVFNPQAENPFQGLGQWDHDLQKAARKPFAKLLAAGRVDRGGLVVSAASVNKFMAERRLSRAVAPDQLEDRRRLSDPPRRHRGRHRLAEHSRDHVAGTLSPDEAGNTQAARQRPRSDPPRRTQSSAWS